MVDILKQDMTNLWAVSGDVQAPSADKIRAGWAVEAVPRQWWNWFENRQDTNIAYMLQKGFPEWDATTEYLQNKSYVQHSGIVYKATVTATGRQPDTNPTYWVRVFADYSVASNALRALTPAANVLPYFTSTTAASTTPLTAFARTILDDADAASVRATISAQATHQNLNGFSGLVASVNAVPYFTSTAGAMDVQTSTAFGRAMWNLGTAAALRTYAGLKGAAIYDPTATRYSTEPDASVVLVKGDFGLGTTDLIDLAVDTDLNTIYATGFYQVGSGNVNRPAGVLSGQMIVMTNAQNYSTQILIPQSSSSFFQRTSDAGVWNAWVQGWNTANLLKTVGNNDGNNGRVQTVGDYGWGAGNNGMPAMDAPSGDLNLATLSGVYRVATGNTNVPAGFGQGAVVLTMMWNNGTGSQLIMQSGNSAMRYGTSLGTATPSWSGWAGVWNSNSLVKTTSTLDTTVGNMLKVGDFNIGVVNPPAQTWAAQVDWAKPNGYSAFINVGATNTAGVSVPKDGNTPAFTYGMWTILGKRDNSNGYTGLLSDYASGRLFIGHALVGTNAATWKEVYTTGNTQALVDQVTAGFQGKLDTKVNKAGDTMTGKLYAPGFESTDEIFIRTPGNTDSVGLTISNNTWETHYDVYGDTWRFFANRLNGSAGSTPLALNLANGAAQVFGNNIWHSGNFNPAAYATVDNLNNTVTNYGYSKGQSDGKYYVNGAGSLVINNGSIPSIAGASSDYAAQSLRIGNNGNNAASSVMSFLRDGSFGCFFGLNTDNNLAWGGWSHGNVAYKIYSERDFNIANYSTNGQNNAYFLAQNQFTAFYTNMAVNTGAEETGCYAALQNISGNTHGLNTIASGNVLRRGGTNGATTETVPGNWRCMGLVQNGVIGLYKRYN